MNECWQKMIENPHGIVLVTEPHRFRKNHNTLFWIKKLARSEINICAVEDPIELVEPQFNQMQVQQAIELDFAIGIRTLLRQDPDIIMIG